MSRYCREWVTNWRIWVVRNSFCYDRFGAESGEHPLLGGVEPVCDAVKERGFAFDGANLLWHEAAQGLIIRNQFHIVESLGSRD